MSESEDERAMLAMANAARHAARHFRRAAAHARLASLEAQDIVAVQRAKEPCSFISKQVKALLNRSRA